MGDYWPRDGSLTERIIHALLDRGTATPRELADATDAETYGVERISMSPSYRRKSADQYFVVPIYLFHPKIICYHLKTPPRRWSISVESPNSLPRKGPCISCSAMMHY